MLAGVIAAVGLATQAYGFFEGSKSSKKQAKYSKKIDALNQQISAQSRQAEQVRKEQAAFDRLRTERNIIRATQRARAEAISRGTSQGANSFVVGQGQGSSAIGGAYGQIAGQGGEALTDLNTNFDFGQRSFAINDRIASLTGQVNQYQSRIATAQAGQDYGRSLFNFGGQLVSGAADYSKTFQSIGGLFK